jgi:hypothetical protein
LASLTKPKLSGARIMADSDITTTLPFVTLGRKGGIAAVAGERISGSVQESGKGGAEPDPALALTRAWIEAHGRTLALCRRQQKLETQLVDSVGFPSATVALPDGDAFTVSSLEDLADFVGDKPVDEITRTKVAAELADRWALWRERDIELGYSAAKEAEQCAAETEQRLLDELPETAAHSIAGVIGKLTVILRECEDNGDPSGFPLPHIRSVLGDLVRITGHDLPNDLQPLFGPSASDGGQGDDLGSDDGLLGDWATNAK